MKISTTKNKRTPFYVDDHGDHFKYYDLRICTWNARTLYREGASIQLADALKKCRAVITAIQEMRWTGQGCKRQAACDIYYSCYEKRREFDCGFVICKRLRHFVSEFNPVNERIAAFRIKAKFNNISLICVHSPTEEENDEFKDAFYAKRENVYDRCSAHDAKIVLGDFNARFGREGIFGPTVGQLSLHTSTSPNGIPISIKPPASLLIDLPTTRSIIL